MGEEWAPFDLIVIGAGINGAAIAREAALGGFRTLLLDSQDLAGGTTSTSSRLIHGGLRYLEHAEFGLVRESLVERERLLEHAPHLVAPLELVIPVYRGARRKRWQVGAGLTLYDLLSQGKSLPNHRMLRREELLLRLPGLDPEGLVGGASYFDGQAVFPERLVIENVRDAVANGATLRTYTAVTAIRVAQGRVSGVEWRSAEGERGGAAAPLVVNAAGPWVDRVLADLAQGPLIGGTKGSHLIVAPFTGAPESGVYVEARSDGRPFFILPWNGLYLIGTTDERFAGEPREAALDDGECAYLAAETARLFPGASGIGERVLYAHSGVRPLPFQPRGAAGAITRRHLVHAHRGAAGLFSVVGGKLTTHRAIAEDVVRRFPRPSGAAYSSPTRARPLPGALPPEERAALLEDLRAKFGARQAQRLSSIYGKAAADVAELARGELAAKLDSASGTLAAELVYALEREWAVTLTDILQRRCMAGMSADFGLRAAEAGAAALQRLGVWEAERAGRELDAYGHYARQHRAAALASRSASFA